MIIDKCAQTERDALMVFGDWDEASTVRTQPYAYDLSGWTREGEQHKDWFVSTALPWLADDAVHSRGEDVRQELLARYLVMFLDYTTELETRIVNRSIVTIAHDRVDFGLSAPLKLTGLKLYADEAYHAVMSAAVANQVSAIYGINNREITSERVQNIRALADAVDPVHAELAWFVIGFVSETVITKEFLKISKATIYTPVYLMLRDHREDELKHSLYFSNLFSIIWQRASKAQQTFISTFIIHAIYEFFRLHKTWLYESLRCVGIDDSSAEIIHERQQGVFPHRARAKAGCTATITAMKRSGFFKDPLNVERFVEAGLL
uniref:Aminobenzoate oxygenase n=1 Tax=Pseudomonas graminis TaxID=158627 RepID=A0A7C2BBV6_9PSED